MKLEIIDITDKKDNVLRITKDKLVTLAYEHMVTTNREIIIHAKKRTFSALSISQSGELCGHGVFLNSLYNWHIVRNEHDELILVPTEK